MQRFCTHTHTWGGNSTTFPTAPYTIYEPAGHPTFVSCPVSKEILVQAVFCTHNHRFAANFTTFLADQQSMEWCKNNHNPATVVPEEIFCKHLHLNASSSTTYPNRCQN